MLVGEPVTLAVYMVKGSVFIQTGQKKFGTEYYVYYSDIREGYFSLSMRSMQ